MELINFVLTTEYIELIKLLKLLNLVESGADAKNCVEKGLVTYNNLQEFRKRKKLRTGDTITFKNYKISIT
ncbi:MAG: RNA-binding protein [Flavobacteriales bacterium CG_4_10_14_0_2_um_filter_32_8]|nr:MAG: RNA-binding protein [Flavobacteriales bacterium CG_4_10_14_0_2_um_filter_32_8]PJB15490.1 MAG: RNA-binding protein [Flavobacteriales bacterium CG_4_9_14_3_um_filter_32_8]